jgi:carboxymethylenebutenolidase
MFIRRALLSCAAAALVANAWAAQTEQETLEKMVLAHQHDEPVPAAAAAGPAVEGVRTQTVVYGHEGDRELKGFIAWPDEAEDPPPAVMLIHEYWGLNDNIREMARKFAAEGYVALAVDLYGGEVADTPEKAEELLNKTVENGEAFKSNLRQGYQFLKESAQAPRIGSVGWCFGGGMSLQAALLLPGELDAAVLYYGFLVQDKERLATLDTPLLGLYGGMDSSIPTKDVERFELTLRALKKPVEMKIYPAAGHAFANPSGTHYNPEAAADAWKRALAFLEKNLKDES